MVIPAELGSDSTTGSKGRTCASPQLDLKCRGGHFHKGEGQPPQFSLNSRGPNEARRVFVVPGN